MSDAVTVEHRAEESRFVALVQEGADPAEAGVAEYELDGETMTLTHTVVDPAFGGRGVGSVLAQAAFGHAREAGLSVVPQCSFMAGYVRKHPELADLVRG
ncbi:GNAT family N-acetyltransferase [Nocardioides bruguierae]|uniref:N-acetyltransferase n=1 Tax=Nocardioides bruguierae TaxID=2945102 RepID=A0A9X2DAM2_9ACTN|nr:GNAT family N-acetyltransferase [Nocardioides bruguierae]MCM0622440.1 N-acetyltransferase [Nocardioides bruguierae]